MPVAQLDRVSDSDSEGRAFESHRAYQKSCILKNQNAAFSYIFKVYPILDPPRQAAGEGFRFPRLQIVP